MITENDELVIKNQLVGLEERVKEVENSLLVVENGINELRQMIKKSNSKLEPEWTKDDYVK